MPEENFGTLDKITKTEQKILFWFVKASSHYAHATIAFLEENKISCASKIENLVAVLQNRFF